MLFGLITLAAAALQADLAELNPSTFQKLVIGRQKSQVWMVLFVNPSDSTSNEIIKSFANASAISEGMINFGIFDVTRGNASETIMSQYTKSIPSIVAFHPKGASEYSGKRTGHGIFNAASTFLQDFTLPIDPSWKDNFISRPSAILFTDKEKTPLVWIGIAAFFNKKSIQFGICRNQSLFSTFGIKGAPKIVFYNGSSVKEYSGEVEFRLIKAAVEEFFTKKLNPQPENEGSEEFAVVSSFEEKCLGARDICVLAIEEKADEELIRQKSINSKHKLRWLVGNSNLPYNFLSKSPIWIYNPRKDAFLAVESVDKLGPTLDRVLDGGAKFTQRKKLLEEKNGGDL